MDPKNHPILPGSRPFTPGTPNPNCPVLLETRQVLEKANNFHRAVRRLRHSTQRCYTCPDRAQCPVVLQHAQALSEAMRLLRREWGLDQ
jgi:hypothetical protein